MADRLLAAAPACTAPVIMRKRFKWFQPKQDLDVQGAGGSLGLPMNGRPGRAGKDLLPGLQVMLSQSLWQQGL